ncbi:hypothetical protein GCM10009851_05310 [Herbiconiux moechotypicola]|uniref:Uncharacterized protein n=1 Tax=Herbiconiux moechotypicola TaxID=637393 RepID=A0ABP5Q5P1_9MICO
MNAERLAFAAGGAQWLAATPPLSTNTNAAVIVIRRSKLGMIIPFFHPLLGGHADSLLAEERGEP